MDFQCTAPALIRLRITSFLQRRETEEERKREREKESNSRTRQISSQVTNTLYISKGNTCFKEKQSNLSMQRLTLIHWSSYTSRGKDINSDVKANTVLSI